MTRPSAIYAYPGEIDVTNFSSAWRQFMDQSGAVREAHVPPRPMPAPAPQRLLACEGCGAPRGPLRICSYCRREG